MQWMAQVRWLQTMTPRYTTMTLTSKVHRRKFFHIILFHQCTKLIPGWTTSIMSLPTNQTHLLKHAASASGVVEKQERNSAAQIRKESGWNVAMSLWSPMLLCMKTGSNHQPSFQSPPMNFILHESVAGILDAPRMESIYVAPTGRAL